MHESSFKGTTRFPLTRVAEDAIDYRLTVSDPSVWSEPWTAVVHLKKTTDLMYEYACHEGNSRTMIGMLTGARADR
jgi:hypothetical protein